MVKKGAICMEYRDAPLGRVRHSVGNYMRNPRSIMLAFVPANVDIATQEIIEIARELDPDGMRTLRIFTKPDLVDKGAEEKIIELVEGKQESQELGWVVVRNLGQKDLQDPSKSRDFEEIFSRSPPWNRLSNDNYGIEALRTRLQALLASNVRREFPLVSVFASSVVRKLTRKFALGAIRSLKTSQRMQKSA